MPDTQAVLVLGAPGSGKTTVSQRFIKQGYQHVNRDKEGGTINDLVGVFDQALQLGQNVVLDNLFPKISDRAKFINIAQKYNVPIDCIIMGTSLEDSQINVLNRMVGRHGQVFLVPDDLKGVKSDPNMFPVAVLFKYRKEAEKPTLKEGFRSIKIEPFVRKWPDDYVNKAAIFDFDGTLRDVPAGAKYPFPTKPEEVMILPGRKEALEGMKANGYLLLGVGNAAYIARKQAPYEMAVKCYERTLELLDIEMDYVFCPHNIPPICYCRKPQSGLGIHFIHKYKLNPAECIYVGDQTTDKTFAERLGMKYSDQADFF